MGLLRSRRAKWSNFKENLTKDYVKPYLGKKKKSRTPPKQYAFVGMEDRKKYVAERTTSAWKLYTFFLYEYLEKIICN